MSEYLILAIIGMLILILVTVFVYFMYSGLFNGIEIRTGKPPIRELHVAYKYAVGPYKNCGPLFTEVTKAAPDLRCFGVYYDDPAKVAPEKLRYIVGAVLSEGDDKEASKELEEKLVQDEFKIAKFPEVDHMVMATFPHINSLSIMIAVQRVYPAFGDYVVQNGLCAHPVMELYDDGIIHFLAPLAKQNEFYVPETGGISPEEEAPNSDMSSKTGESSSGEDQEGGGQEGTTGSDSGSSFEELNVNEDA
ncbi:testis-expressed protein 264-like [Amphiura filiformis]|uniref:testis-expressed protein 264-like n=1 Tax=Amphiura filiformis TaxID=82378 RepID=UPI003B225306